MSQYYVYIFTKHGLFDCDSGTEKKIKGSSIGKESLSISASKSIRFESGGKHNNNNNNYFKYWYEDSLNNLVSYLMESKLEEEESSKTNIKDEIKLKKVKADKKKEVLQI